MDLSGVTRDVVVPVRVDPAGRTGPTPDQARGPHWRRTSRGFYVPADVDPTTVEQRIVEAAVALPDTWGGVTGWAALAWAGAVWFDGSPWGGGTVRPVTLAVGGNRTIRSQSGFATSEERLLPGDLVVVDGLRVTRPVRSVCFEMRYARSVVAAVTTLDMACFNDVVSLDEVAEYAAALSGWTGIPRYREAAALSDENAWSPREVEMRDVWSLAAPRVRPLCNRPVFDTAGGFLATPDLIDPVAGVVGEYDSALHLPGPQWSRDLDRTDLFRSHGLEPVSMVSSDLLDPTHFVRRLQSAYERAAEIPASRRRWTLEMPPWWRDTTTVEARRSLDEAARARLLAHRAA
ncbi:MULTISPECIES: hypothetical protein [unclassified Nocardioides]|uniref:hypothetical protein n=1 Tax=unclassified Nocardioides TaxID=2615069 RepID=UPI0009EFD607|nr:MULTISPECIES: hypothetical protein [unclassified Nocardioides]GAW51791.1 uncharacterized protein PD653B2_4140 [Nocardioides sp. PD653-B2]GAW55241.1 uncharacterized protein PD653_2662 [Nocardioides sp. PD653]